MASLLKGALFSMLLSVSLSATDHGIRGHLFEVEEESLLEYIESRASLLTEEKLSAFRREVRSTLNPTPLGLREATEYRLFYHDPTITVQQEIRDLSGHVIVAKGSRVNPLESASLGSELLFFDAEQVEWARDQDPGAKWILVSGHPQKMENSEGRAVYFDQFGVITKKFGIKRVPARLSQEGMVLKIEEIPWQS